MKAYMKSAIAIIISVLGVICMAMCKPKKPEPQFIPKWSAVQLLREQRDELTDWQMLILAIAFTESRFQPDAIGNAGDSGILQITKPYTDELNRLYNTSYTPADAFDIDSSLEMFELMQSYYNDGRDIEKAIYFHNKSAAYRKTVLENIELIRNYETLRSKITKK